MTLRAAQKGSSEAQFSLGLALAYEQGLGMKKDNTQAVNRLRNAAEQGNPSAQFNLGYAYYQGQGVKKDYAQAIYWYRKAAKQGHAAAQCNLGCAYSQGQGVIKDYAQAIYWYRKAAKQGQANAQFNLGLAYADGEGVKKDKSEAFVWFRNAAERGHADAQFQIGTMYANGKGIEANDVEAFNWYFKAAGNGSVDAQLELASVYQQGLGVKKDVLQATYWLLKSAVDATGREIFPNDIGVAEDFISDVIQCIPVALTTFPEFKFIKTINFQLFKLSDKDFLSIGQMIRANPNLKGLNFKCQEIDDVQALILLQSLAFNTTLTELIFDDEYGFDASIFDQIKSSLAQNVVIAELREHMKNNPIKRSDELPYEVLDIIVDDMIVAASKGGKDSEGNRIEPTSKEATIAAIDEFLKRASQQTLKDDLKNLVYSFVSQIYSAIVFPV
jgi:TPR repeat protein